MTGSPPHPHAAEAEERWGDTEAFRESRRRTSTYTTEDWTAIKAERDEIEAEFAMLRQENAPSDGPRARVAARRHQDHISRWFYPCTPEIHVGLGRMYVDDARFAAHYDGRSPGLAACVSAAIAALHGDPRAS